MKVMKLAALFILLMGIIHAGISVTNFSVSQDSFKPGGNGILTIVVTNPVTAGVQAYKMTGVSVTAYPPPEIAINAPSNIGDIDAGGSTIVSMPFKVGSDAKSGVYVVELQLRGFSQSATTAGQDVYAKSATVPVTVVNTPLLGFDLDKDLISGVDPIALMITNNGGPANNMQIKIADSSQITLYKTTGIFAGVVSKNKSVNVTLDSRSAQDGPANIPLIINYEDELGLSHSDTASLRVTIKNEKLDLRFVQFGQLVTKTENMLSLEAFNSGTDISDVRLSFPGTSVRLKDSNELKMGDLVSGGRQNISGMAFIDLPPGLNAVNATIRWVEKDIQKEESISVPLKVASDADVGVYLESKPSPLVAGQEHTISVLVSNLGSFAIDNVDVGLNSTAFDLLDVTPRQYIGSLAKDDFSTVQFKVRMKSSTGDYPFTVGVRYRDASGEWTTKSITQTASVNPAPAADSTPLYVGVVIILLALAIWYFKFRKREEHEQVRKG